MDQQGTAIQVDRVSVAYETDGGTITALDDVSLEVGRGELVTVIGPSGCGKSTLLGLVAGLQLPTAGEVRILGEPVRGPAPRKTAVVFQDYTLFPWRTVQKNVEVGLEFRRVERRERAERARAYLELVGLSAFAERYPGELSGGMKQRVAIARALTLEPEILLMDEPFGALDEQTRLVLGVQLSQILERTRRTILFITHSLAEAVLLSDRIVVLTARPGRVKEVLQVDVPHPRQPDFMLDEGFNRLRNRLFESLRDEMVRAVGG